MLVSDQEHFKKTFVQLTRRVCQFRKLNFNSRWIQIKSLIVPKSRFEKVKSKYDESSGRNIMLRQLKTYVKKEPNVTRENDGLSRGKIKLTCVLNKNAADKVTSPHFWPASREKGIALSNEL